MTSRQTRRLQLSGGSTFVVSLPKVWIEDLELKAGDNVTMTRNANKSLTFIPDGDAPGIAPLDAVVEIGSETSDESIRRRITAVYLAGYKSIKIVSRGIRLGAGQVSAIRSMVRSAMIGTEIVEADSESLVIQILTRLPELSFDVALKRMHLMTSSMHMEAVEALASANADYAAEIAKMGDEIDRFGLYMLRNLMMAVQNASVLQEVGLGGPSDCLAYRTVVFRIEKIADHAALIAKRVKYLNGPVEKDTMEKIMAMSCDALKVFDRCMESLAGCDYHMAEAAADEIPGIVEKQEKLAFNLQDGTRNASAIKFALDDIGKTAEYAGDIAEVVMNKNVQNVIRSNAQSDELAAGSAI